MYDPATNTWTRIADNPETMSHGSTVVVGNVVWVIGSFSNNEAGPASTHVELYDTAANKWSYGPPLPGPAGAGGAVLVGTKIHFFGGLTRDATNTFVNTTEHWVLDLNNQAAGWTNDAAGFPHPRNHFGTAVLNGKVYVIGGQDVKNEQTGTSSLVDVYDPATDSWSSAAPLPIPCGHNATSCVIYKNTILVVGGETNGKATLSRVTQYDPVANTWTDVPSLALPRPTRSPIVALIGSTLIVTDGGNFDPTSTIGWSRILA